MRRLFLISRCVLVHMTIVTTCNLLIHALGMCSLVGIHICLGLSCLEHILWQHLGGFYLPQFYHWLDILDALRALLHSKVVHAHRSSLICSNPFTNLSLVCPQRFLDIDHIFMETCLYVLALIECALKVAIHARIG